MKKFSSTLYFYSQNNHRFLRIHFCLDGDKTITEWMTSFHCNVGFLNEVLDFLELEVERKDYLSECALIFDAVAIRK